MIGNILDTKPAHSLAVARVELGGEEHPDSYVDTCVTHPRQFAQLARYKSKGRLYRPRIWKTIQKSGFNPYKSENIIFFDVYLVPRRTNHFGEKKKEEEEEEEGEGGRPESGEKVKLSIITKRLKDHVTIQEFEIEIQDVWWGRVTTTTDEQTQIRDVITVGLIEARVMGSYDRSLIIDSDFNIKKNMKQIAA